MRSQTYDTVTLCATERNHMDTSLCRYCSSISLPAVAVGLEVEVGRAQRRSKSERVPPFYLAAVARLAKCNNHPALRRHAP